MRGGLEKWIDANVGTRGDCDHDRDLVGWPGQWQGRVMFVPRQVSRGVTFSLTLNGALSHAVSRLVTGISQYPSVSAQISYAPRGYSNARRQAQ